MRNAGGYAVLFGPDGGVTERDTFTCFHCNSVVYVKPKSNPDDFGSMCRLCMKMVCQRCANFGCTPFEKKLEQIEARDRARRSYGI